MENIEQELMKLEFRHKKDVVEAEQRFNERFDRIQAQLDQTQLHLEHLSKLAGITFENFTDIELRIENAANALRPKAK